MDPVGANRKHSVLNRGSLTLMLGLDWMFGLADCHISCSSGRSLWAIMRTRNWRRLRATAACVAQWLRGFSTDPLAH
eukprot:scaffold4522_cov141-Skeletonema_menzelii.AAC.8